MKTNIRRIVFYPIIFCIIPLVSVYLRNIIIVDLTEFLRAALIALLILALLWWGLFKFTGSFRKSALISTIFFILFFSYGQVIPGLAILFWKLGLDIHSQLLNNVRLTFFVILFVSLTLFLLLSYLIIKMKSDLKIITTFMNGTSIILFTLIIYNNASYINYQMRNIRNKKILVGEKDGTIQADPGNLDYPDIYFIILDGYGRDDSLADYFNFDNQELLTFLTDEGFYISTESRSNYLLTILSIASNLNMDYLNDLAVEMGTTSENTSPILQSIQHNRLMDFLSGQGYKTITFQSGYHATEMEQVDQYYSNTSNLTEYETAIVSHTPLQVLFNNYHFENSRKRIRYTFEQLPEIVSEDQPTFVFAHVMSPHDPFIFGPNGEAHNPTESFSLWEENPPDIKTGRMGFIEDYTNQVSYINSLVRETVEEILSKPGKKPIIIIQGDHGPRPIWYWNSMENSDLQTIFPILNAYYFPDQDYSNLYPGISSVNTFRVVLDNYFGTQLGLLEDKSYFSTMRRPYNYIDVTDQIEN